jgi:S-formylglutathione hydrolase FrmB
MRPTSLGLVLALLMILCGQAHAAGTVETVQFYAPSLGEDRWASVYLPEGYDPSSPVRYPVIYFCHGADGSHLLYPELYGILDDLISSQQVSPVIMIKPNGSGCSWPPYWEGCGWVNSTLQGNYEDFLVEDVIAFADSTYKTIPSPHKRALMGHSMGAFGVMHAALKHPDLYRAVAAHSGYLHFDEMYDQHISVIIDEQQGEPPWEYTPNSIFTGAWFMLSGGFSPNFFSPPYNVDFPLDGWGVRIPETWERWLEFDPATLALTLTPEESPAIYFDCGTYDEFLLHPINVRFDEHLTALGIDHQWESYVGGHGNMLQQRFPIALAFLDGAMNDPAAMHERDSIHGHPILFFDVPSPAVDNVQITFELSDACLVRLELFDVLGRRQATLLDGEPLTGTHVVRWEPRGVPAGVYFCRLEAGRHCERRMLILN